MGILVIFLMHHGTGCLNLVRREMKRGLEQSLEKRDGELAQVLEISILTQANLVEGLKLHAHIPIFYYVDRSPQHVRFVG